MQLWHLQNAGTDLEATPSLQIWWIAAICEYFCGPNEVVCLCQILKLRADIAAYLLTWVSNLNIVKYIFIFYNYLFKVIYMCFVFLWHVYTPSSNCACGFSSTFRATSTPISIPIPILTEMTGRGVGGDGNVASHFKIAQIKQGNRRWHCGGVGGGGGGNHNRWHTLSHIGYTTGAHLSTLQPDSSAIVISCSSAQKAIKTNGNILNFIKKIARMVTQNAIAFVVLLYLLWFLRCNKKTSAGHKICFK